MKKLIIFVIAILCLIGLNSCSGVIWTDPYGPYYQPYRPYYYRVPAPRHHHHHHHHHHRHHCQDVGEKVDDVVMFNTLT